MPSCRQVSSMPLPWACPASTSRSILMICSGVYCFFIMVGSFLGLQAVRTLIPSGPTFGEQDIRILQAVVEDVSLAAPLFDAYRQFYGQRPDLPGAAAFLTERLSRGESVLFLALD